MYNEGKEIGMFITIKNDYFKAVEFHFLIFKSKIKGEYILFTFKRRLFQ